MPVGVFGTVCRDVANPHDRTSRTKLTAPAITASTVISGPTDVTRFAHVDAQFRVNY